MDYTREELAEAKRQIDSTLHKLRQTVKTLEAKENPARYKYPSSRWQEGASKPSPLPTS